MFETLTARRTSKVIGNTDNPSSKSGEDRESIGRLLAAAGNAPFHYACDRVHQQNGGSPVPWRVHALDRAGCRTLMDRMIARGDVTKIPNMLAAADCLLQVTWLPDEGTLAEDPTAKEGAVFEGTLRNLEHIAAASAFIQSLLLAATAEGHRTYWSSGGPLRGSEVFDELGISAREMLLGAVFLFPADPQDAEIRPGSLAEKRGEPGGWLRFVDI